MLVEGDVNSEGRRKYFVRAWDAGSHANREIWATSSVNAARLCGIKGTVIVIQSYMKGNSHYTSTEYIDENLKNKDLKETPPPPSSVMDGLTLKPITEEIKTPVYWDKVVENASESLSAAGYSPNLKVTHGHLDGPDALDAYHAITFFSIMHARPTDEDNGIIWANAHKIAKGFKTHKQPIKFLAFLKKKWEPMRHKEVILLQFVRQTGDVPAELT